MDRVEPFGGQMEMLADGLATIANLLLAKLGVRTRLRGAEFMPPGTLQRPEPEADVGGFEQALQQYSDLHNKNLARMQQLNGGKPPPW